MQYNPLLLVDFYKIDHRYQYPKNTTELYSNLTARKSNSKTLEDFDNNDKIVFFGLQYFIKYYLIDLWENNFFKKPKHEVIDEF